MEELKPAKCNVPIKNDLSKCLHAALFFIEIQNKTMGKLLGSTGGVAGSTTRSSTISYTATRTVDR